MKWEDVCKEMVETKGLDKDKADLIGHYVNQHGGKELVEALMSDTLLKSQKSAQEGLEEMRLLLQYCEHYGVLDKVCQCAGECYDTQHVHHDVKGHPLM